jgi:long-chain acyl-CoA synthetase
LVNALLGSGVGKGDRLAVLSHNSPEFLEVFGAAEKGGFVAAPLSWRLLPADLLALIRDARPAVLFVQERHLPKVEPILNELGPVHLVLLGPSRDGWNNYENVLSQGSDTEPRVTVREDDLAYLIYTSGTTGSPRAAMLTHEGQLAHSRRAAAECEIDPLDVNLNVMPLFHIAGHNMRLAHSLVGCAQVIKESFDPLETLRTIEEERVTFLQVVPAMVARLLDMPGVDGFDLRSLKTILYASSPMPVELLRRGLQVFGPVFMQAYGQTEGGPSISMLPKSEHVDREIVPGVSRLASAGRPLPEVTVEVRGDDDRPRAQGELGEICVRSPWVMKGYWEKPDLSAEVFRNGLLHTGDIGFMDEEGFVYVVDRKKDMIITGGLNVYPREVEEVLYEHPAVLEAAVIGVPDPVWVEAVKALVVLKQGTMATEGDLIRFCGDRLAGYKKPKSVEFRDNLPKNPSGKILKRELREEFRPATAT